MPLINSGKKASLSPNIATEIRAGKPRDQAAAIAYSVMRHAKSKKMAHGGKVDDYSVQEDSYYPGLDGQDSYMEEEFKNSSDHNHFGENSLIAEPQHYEQATFVNRGFDRKDIDSHKEHNLEVDEDVLPMRFAHGGTAPMNHLDQIYRKKFLEAKKMAYGGEIEPASEVINGDDYAEHDEENREIEHEEGFEHGPLEREAESDPSEDQDRKSFVRGYLARKAVRR